MKNALLVLSMLLPAAIILQSCTSETSLGTVEDKLRDTVTVYQTRHDTVYLDTLILRETRYVSADSADILFFGLVYNLGVTGTTLFPDDSSYVSLTTFSDPLRRDLSVTVNATPLAYSTDQPVGVVGQGLFQSTSIFPMLQSVLYESTIVAAAAYAFQIVVPVYPSDTTLPVTYDTITDQTPAPGMIDTIVTSGPDGVYEVVDEAYCLVDNWQDVTVAWTDSADFYLVSVARLVLTAQGAFSTIGETLDTFVVDTQMVIPAAYLWMDESTVVGQRYDIAEVDVIPLTGPSPEQWDTLPSFDSHGILIGVRADYTYELLVPTRPDTALAKRPTVLRKGATRTKSALEMVKRALE